MSNPLTHSSRPPRSDRRLEALDAGAAASEPFKEPIDGLTVAVGIVSLAILLFLALSGLGMAVKFIPRPIVIGFTNGIAVLIISTQVKDFLGLEMSEIPSEFIARIAAYVSAIATITVSLSRSASYRWP